MLTGKELPWPKAASVVGLFHIRMSPIGPEPKHALTNGMSAFEGEPEERLRYFDSRL